MNLKTTQKFIDSYYNLRKQIDDRAYELSELHSTHLKCQKGCDSCCESINIFPIEFAAIQNELQKQQINLPKRKFNRFRKSCMFLKNGSCTIYKSRPIICRTQGLPLMYQSLNGEGYEVSHCQLNFKEFNVNNFTIDISMFMPDFNSKLFLLNKDFVETNHILKGDFKKRIPLYKLFEHNFRVNKINFKYP